MTEDFKPINITLGSNKFIETNGIISVKGKEFFKMELAGDMRPLITVEIRNQKDELLGKVWKSTSFVHSHQDYEPIYERENNTLRRLALRRKSDNEDIFEIIFHAPNDVEINGVFYVKGLNFPIIATKGFLDLNTNKFSRCVKYKGKTGIAIDNDFMSF